MKKFDWLDEAGFQGYDFSKKVWNVLDYGADPNGVFLCHQAFQKAIDDCSAYGGGLVLVPLGHYHMGSIFLKDNVHLKLRFGVKIYASMNLSDYPVGPSRIAGIEMDWPLALINVRNASNVKISGKAEISGRGAPFWSSFLLMKKHYEEQDLRWILDYDCQRPRMLVLENAKNCQVQDVLLKESPFWTVQILYSKHITVDGILIRNYIEGLKAPSSDGIDIDSSSYILIQNCDVESQDDNLCLKAGRDADGLEVNRPCCFVYFKNNRVSKGAALVTFGSETSGGIHDIVVSGLRGENTPWGIKFKSARNRGGFIKNIYIEKVNIRNTPFVFEFSMNWNPKYSYCQLPEAFSGFEIPDYWHRLLKKVSPPERGLCHLSDVRIQDVKVEGKCWKAFRVESFKEAPIENFSFENMEINTEIGGEIANAKNWQFKSCRFNYDDGVGPELLACENIDGLVPTV